MKASGDTLKIVALGGGTGLPVLLKGLRRLAHRYGRGLPVDLSIAAVVTVADNGESGGLLSQSLGMPALGDLRNCLAVMSEGAPVLLDLFQRRFLAGGALQGHTLGNLILTALFQRAGSLNRALDLASQLLQVRGRVLPVTETPVTLCVQSEDGTAMRREGPLRAAAPGIKRAWLDPVDPPACPAVLQAISSAHVIVVGPGSLYTSLVSNFLVAGVAQAIRDSSALRVFVCNLMTEPGETDHFTASDHLRVIQSYLGPETIDVCLLNAASVFPAERYLVCGSEPVLRDDDEVARMNVVPIAAELSPEGGDFCGKHDPVKLGQMILFLASGVPGRSQRMVKHPSWVA